jgi:2,4-dienoyl-CoA reductase-like NADH-dependent reductase (Old Yellow Enzyme family)
MWIESLSATDRSRRKSAGNSHCTFKHRGSLVYNETEGFPLNEIRTVISDFISAAERAREARFDGVEIDASSAHFNKSSDNCGVDFEGRMRLSVQIVRGILEHYSSAYPKGVELCV